MIRAILLANATAATLNGRLASSAFLGQQGTLTRVWAKRGTRPRAPRDQRYEWAYIFGAVCPERSLTAALVLPCANAEAMNLHLAEISKQVAAGAHAVLLLDGAGYHQEAALELPHNISLLPLPPYSPELPRHAHNCKAPSVLRKRVNISLNVYLDCLFAGMNFDAER
jgi:hypothetical protein